jgi:hypothetical protein
MDLLYFLKARLRFIEQLYDSATSPFGETKRKINAHVPPYVDRRDSEYVSEPAFFEEWQQADDSVMVVGHWCLCMVQASLHSYLRECIGPNGGRWWNSEKLRTELCRKKSKHSFGRYRLLFLEDLGVDWSDGPVALDELEQLNLTRDDLIHEVKMLSMSVERDEKHAKRYPTGLFVVKIDKEKLLLAIQLVEKFCAWLDGIRCRYPKYLKEVRSADQPHVD